MTSPSRNSEAAARAAIEEVAARALTDGEWERQRARLVEFVSILRNWNRQADGRKKHGFAKVVTIGACESALDEACESLEKAA